MERYMGLSRRAFVRRAVAVGGVGALAACVERSGMPDLPAGPADLSTIPERQHAWNTALATDGHGNVRAPRHHVLLLLTASGSGPPTDADRDTLETTLRALERAVPRGNDGLAFTIGYSPAYFARLGGGPTGADLPEPRALASFEDPAFDRPDAVLHLASDHGQVVLAAEAALFGEREGLNDQVFETDLSDVFERDDRRTGFVGAGLPADNDDVAGIPDGAVDDESPMFMGFKSGFKENQATEDQVTITTGPFAGGTTQQISRIRLNLGQWYNQDSRDQRVAKMFCPMHAEEGLVEGTGDNLGDSSQLGECPAHTEDDARTRGLVGHSQKSARARREDSPIILRRDFASTDGDHTGLHFVSLQREITDFVETREAMNGADLVGSTAVGQRTNNGILQYMTVDRRGNYLIPPRSLRAFPPADP